MIDSLISGYLAGEKRLVVPDLGAFIRKDEGEVVFVEFLKKDDSVLSGLIGESLGVGGDEAREIIAEFAGWIRSRIAEAGTCPLEGLGTMRRDSAGLLELVYDPSVRRSAPSQPEEPATDTAEPAPAITEEEIREEPVAAYAAIATPDNHEEEPAPEAEASEDIIIIERRDEPEPSERISAEPASSSKRWENIMDSPSEENRTPAQSEARDWYGMPVEEEQDTEDDEAEDFRSPERDPYNRPQRPRRPVRNMPPDFGLRRKRADMVMIIAIIAAVVAVGSIIFGVMTQRDPMDMMQPTNPPAHTEAPAETPEVEAPETNDNTNQ